MSEVLDQLDVQQEVVTPESEPANVPEDQQVPEPQPEPSKEDPQEKNWRAARLKLEEQSHQIRLLNQELESIRRQSQPKAPEKDEEEFFTETERKLHQKLKNLESKMQQNQAKESDYVVDRLRSKYSDFDEVLHPENITWLQTNNAALAKALASLKDDPYEQGLAAYDALKNTSWYQQRHTMQDKVKLEANSKKPVSVQAVRKQGALSEANRFTNGLTPELKSQLLKEMAEARKGA